MSKKTKPIKNRQVDSPISVSSRNKKIIFFIFLLSFLFYGNTIPNDFSMDDELVSKDHATVSKGISGIPQIFSERYVNNNEQSYEYRPIVLVTFAIEHQFTGGNPQFSHFINVLLYALTGVLIFYLLSRLFIQKHWLLPFSVTVLFLAHPIHSEVVASLKNRDELLSFIFTLLTIRAILNYFDKNKLIQLLYAVLFFTLSILSKKSSFPLIATLPLTLYFFKDINWKKALLYFFLPVSVMLLFRLFMSMAFEQQDRPGLYYENPMYVDKVGMLHRIPIVFYCLAFYVKMLFVPYPLIMYYGYNTVPIADWGNIISIVSILILGGFSIYCFLKIKTKKIWIFGFLYFMFNAGAMSNIIPMPGIVAERFVYGASLGFIIFIVDGIFTLTKSYKENNEINISPQLKYSFIAILIFSNIYMIQRNKDWHDHLTTYETDVVKAPNSAKLHALIGGFCMQELTLQRVGKKNPPMSQQEELLYIKKAEKHFQLALKILPEYVACLNNYGTLYYNYLNNNDSALVYFKKVVDLDPKHVQGYFNIGSYYENELINVNAFLKFIEIGNLNSSIEEISLTTEEQKKFLQFYKGMIPLVSEHKILINDATNIIQEFINANRAVGNASVDPQNFINAYNSSWDKAKNKYLGESASSVSPAQAIFDYLLSNQAKDEKEFVSNLQLLIGKKFREQFGEYVQGEFKKIYNSEADSLIQFKMIVFARNMKSKYEKEMMQSFNTALTAKNLYAPAYTKLSGYYNSEQMWDSLINLNLRMAKSDDIKRFVDIHKLIGNGYLNKNDKVKALFYYEKAMQEEEIIFQKLNYTIQQHSNVGNQVVVAKFNQQINNVRTSLSSTYNYMGSLYSEIGKTEDANRCFQKFNMYKL